MGLMTQILSVGEKKNQNSPEPEKPAEKIRACEKCGNANFWESIYLDSVLRCETCEPAPSPAMVGRWVGPAAELLQQVNNQAEHEPADTDPDRFVEYITADGRRGLALRGFDNPRHTNYSQRTCAYVAIGVAQYDAELDQLQGEWRTEILR